MGTSTGLESSRATNLSGSRKKRENSADVAAGNLRPRLLALATQTFAQHGYVGASLRDIADLAGVTAAAVYYHFAKKEDMLREIVFDGLERIAKDVIDALATAHSPEAALEAVVRAHLRYNVECPQETKIIIEDSRFLNEADYAASREKQNAILNVYRACVRELMASGVIEAVNPTITSFNIVSIILGWYRWYHTDGPVSKVDAFEATVRFAMAAVHIQNGGTVLGPAGNAAK